jgi:uncharacterized protein (TIGR03437 family)
MKQLTTSIIIRAVIGLCVAGAWPLAAQGPTFDSSGNSLLNGNYYFRQVFYIVGDNSGDLSEAVSLYGHITFNQNGTYSISDGLVMDSANNGVVTLACEVATSCNNANLAGTVNGTYTMAASGYGYISNPITGDSTFVLLGNSGSTTAGLITGSSTETALGYNDMFIAAKNGATVPSTGTFNGAYTMAAFIPGGAPTGTADLFFQMNPNGAGSLGTVTVSGYVGGSGTSIQTQTSSNVKYIFSNGAAIVQFPTSNTALFFAGNEYLYFSPDNNFVFGGSPNGFDMIVGIRNDNAGTNENFTGPYYQSGIDQDLSTFASSGSANLDTFYGSFGAGSGNIVGSQRLQSVFFNNSFSLTFSDTYPTPITGSGSVTDGFTQFAYGDGGAVRIGAGIWPFLGLTVAFPAITPAATGSVYLNPTGVANAGSSAPFTAGIANGELITLYGTNLAPAGLVVSPGIPFPTTLNGVQVSINGINAPIYYVSPTQVSVIVPFENPFSVAQISVINNGVASNNGVAVTVFVDKSAIGLFTTPAGGIGPGALVHNADGTLVTAANPAKPGEFVQAFVTGLGGVIPVPSPDGAAGSTDPNNLNNSIYFSSTAASNQITAFVDGVSAPVVFAGLAPGLAGLYQIDLQIPAGVTVGTDNIDLFGPDSQNSEATIEIGSGTLANTSSASGVSAQVKRAGPRTRRASPSTTRPTLRQAAPSLLSHTGGSIGR